MMKVIIQHDTSSGLYHPAVYLLAPLPGKRATPQRYESVNYHTLGFTGIGEAQNEARNIANKLLELEFPVDIPPTGFPVHELEEAGVDVFVCE
jgi:hypothetical protein